MTDLRTLADGAAAAWADAPEEFRPLLRDCADALAAAAEEIDRLKKGIGDMGLPLDSIVCGDNVAVI